MRNPDKRIKLVKVVNNYSSHCSALTDSPGYYSLQFSRMDDLYIVERFTLQHTAHPVS